MSIRIFHTADLHVGMKFTRGYPPEVQEKLIEGRFEALRRMVAMANQRGCDLFVIAGDLFDRPTAAKKEILRVAEILKEFEGSCVLILPGNHDYLQKGEEHLWTRFHGAMSERTLLLENPSPCDLRPLGLDAVVYPGPCTAKHSAVNAIGWIREVQKDPAVRLHIGVAHGSLEGISPDFGGDYYPMSMDELRTSGVDLWLMGHTHLRHPDREEGSESRIFFPSTPEPDGFDCRHPGYAWLIELKGGGAVHYQSLQTGQYQFVTVDRGLSSEEEVESLKSYFHGLDRKKHLVKLKLKGRLRGDSFNEREGLVRELSQSVLHLESDLSELLKDITEEEIDREFTEGSFPHRLLKTLDQEGKSPLALQMAYDLVQEAKS
jgi:DNA repair exonuclease SbcCD nuclease subunit